MLLRHCQNTPRVSSEETAAKAAEEAKAAEAAAAEAAAKAEAEAKAAADAAASATEAMDPTKLFDANNFDAAKVGEMIDGSALDDATKATLKRVVDAAKSNPALLQGALDQVKAVLGL